ncbi:MAG TPA: NUDIX domain-containing protein [Phenylobacterium sp.]|jgi:predicted NUDIX family NTP pyrophosphohydrolase|uniref:NUDIX domain-containing protein n=1 Tax=Phenylobacterium sp. TaxID=1871053 RepID=UPI002D37175D|nr:NUDIX domain-containing protein [Phenylobacterium sp.]HZZ66882.1 NUDIX domain-containing protein [Phenylobacterium sp.]
MAREVSAGVLAWRRGAGGPEFLLVHPGGPYWAGKDEAAWSIPKGLVEAGEASWAAAQREFAEELGQPILGEPVALEPCPTPGGKLILAWLVEADLDVSEVVSNLFEIEWPPRSGRRASFPEVDRAGYFGADTALAKLHKGQRPILLDAVSRLNTWLIP